MLGDHHLRRLGPGLDGRRRNNRGPAAIRPGERLSAAHGAFWVCAELPFVRHAAAAGIRAEIAILDNRRPVGTAYRLAEPVQQRRRAGYAKISQQPADREGGAHKRATSIELVRAQCSTYLERRQLAENNVAHRCQDAIAVRCRATEQKGQLARVTVVDVRRRYSGQ